MIEPLDAGINLTIRAISTFYSIYNGNIYIIFIKNQIIIEMKAKIASQEIPLGIQINKFCQSVPDYATLLGLTPAKVALLIATNPLLQFVLSMNPELLKTSHSFTSFKTLLLHGNKNEVLGAIPLLPVYPAILPTVTIANVRGLFSEIVQECIKSPKFTENIGIILGIIDLAPEPKPDEGTAVLAIKLASGGHPLLHVPKGIYQGYEVWRDKGDGKGYIRIATSLYADYLDASELPPVNVSQHWKYKAINIYKGEPTGNWSVEVGVIVYGVI